MISPSKRTPLRINEHHDHTLLRSLWNDMKKDFWNASVNHEHHDLCILKVLYNFPCLSMRIMISSFEEHLSKFKLKSWAQWSHIFKRTLLFPQILVRIMIIHFEKLKSQNKIAYEAWWTAWSPMPKNSWKSCSPPWEWLSLISVIEWQNPNDVSITSERHDHTGNTSISYHFTWRDMSLGRGDVTWPPWLLELASPLSLVSTAQVKLQYDYFQHSLFIVISSVTSIWRAHPKIYH